MLSAQTIAAIESIALPDLATHGLRRALLLDQDGIPTDGTVATALAEAGVEVTQRAGSRMGRHDLPPGAAVRADRGVRDRPRLAGRRGDPGGRDAAARDRRDGRARPRPHGRRVVVRETPLFVDGPAGRLFGILTRPATAPAAPIGGLFLNAGAVRRIGPTASGSTPLVAGRRAAWRPLRLDLEGIGDADGTRSAIETSAQFYVRDEVRDQIRGAIDALVDRGHGPRIVLAGLCAGGFWAFRGAAADERVTAALLLNPGALEWHPRWSAREAARLHRLRQVHAWQKILRGGVPLARMRMTAAAALRQTGRSMAAVPAARSAVGRRREARCRRRRRPSSIGWAPRARRS